jgi:hypothetical protein
LSRRNGPARSPPSTKHRPGGAHSIILHRARSRVRIGPSWAHSPALPPSAPVDMYTAMRLKEALSAPVAGAVFRTQNCPFATPEGSSGRRSDRSMGAASARSPRPLARARKDPNGLRSGALQAAESAVNTGIRAPDGEGWRGLARLHQARPDRGPFPPPGRMAKGPCVPRDCGATIRGVRGSVGLAQVLRNVRA